LAIVMQMLLRDGEDRLVLDLFELYLARYPNNALSGATQGKGTRRYPLCLAMRFAFYLCVVLVDSGGGSCPPQHRWQPR